MKQYTPPKIYDARGDHTKLWYVYYSFLNPSTGKKELKKVRGGINRIKNRREKISAANDLLKQVVDNLERGYTPFEQEDEFKTLRLIEVFPKIIDLKKNLRRRSWQSYKYALDALAIYLKKKKRDYIKAPQFTELDALGFSDYALTTLKWSPVTYNHNKSNLSICFNVLVDRKVIPENPWRKIKRLKEEVGKNLAFSDKQRDKLKEALLREDPRLYIFVQFMYYCYIRPKEILGLKIENIDTKNWSIQIPGNVSKNKKTEFVTIPQAFRDTILQLRLEEYPQEYFIFSQLKGMLPGKTIRGRNSVSRRHSAIMKDLNFSKDYTMYSWKHTGVVAAYKAGVDLYSLMRQCRHHDLSETTKYLKSLGLIDNTEFSSKQAPF